MISDFSFQCRANIILHKLRIARPELQLSGFRTCGRINFTWKMFKEYDWDQKPVQNTSTSANVKRFQENNPDRPDTCNNTSTITSTNTCTNTIANTITRTSTNTSTDTSSNTRTNTSTNTGTNTNMKTKRFQQRLVANTCTNVGFLPLPHSRAVHVPNF